MMPTGLAQNLSFILLGEDRTASKTMTKAQQTAEVVTGRIGSAFSKLGGIVGGEFGQILDQAGSSIDEIGAKGVKLSTVLEAGGGIVAGAGLGLMQLGSGAKQASDQLNQAIKNVGDSTSQYADKIDKAVARGQNFDHSAEDTKLALQKLIPATGSTQKALDNMSVVTDLAAAKHISLADAATQVAKILNGTGAKALAGYGIVMEKAVDPSKALAAAQHGVEAASTTLASAQKKLADMQEIDHTKKKLTLSDHIALQNAQDAVTAASTKLSAAQEKLAGTSTQVITKTEAGQNALDQLSKKLNGQASASVNNFGSQFDIVKTKVEDFVKDAAGPVGQTMTVLGPIFSVAGLAIDVYKTKQEAASIATLASRDAAVADSVAMDTKLIPSTIAANGSLGKMGGIMGALSSPAGIAAVGVAAVYAASQIGTLTDAAYNNTIQFGKAKDAAKAYDKQLGLDQAGPKGLFGNANTNRGQALQLTTGANEGVGQFFTSVGLGGLNQQFEGATASITKIDASIAHLVQTGNAQEANLEFQKWADAAKAQGLSIDALKAKFPDYEAALGSVANSEILAAQGADRAAGSLASLAQSAGLKSAGYVSPAAAKKHAAGGIFTKTTQIGNDIFGESGAEAVIPLNAGLQGFGGGGDTYNITVAPQGLMSGTPQQLAQQLMTLLINGAKNGTSKTELKHALGLV